MIWRDSVPRRMHLRRLHPPSGVAMFRCRVPDSPTSNNYRFKAAGISRSRIFCFRPHFTQSRDAASFDWEREGREQ
jgi:hypothetical protein